MKKPRTAGAVLDPVALDRIAHMVAPAGPPYDLPGVMAIAADLGEQPIYGVRDAKGALSRILNDATEGGIAFIEAGNGAMVAVIGADSLCRIVVSAEERATATVADAIASLPYPPDTLRTFELVGYPPGHGLLAGVHMPERPVSAHAASTADA
jgi:hypothetical protein